MMSLERYEGPSTLRGAETVVVVVPLGGTADTVFREYVELVSQQCQCIDLNALRSFYSAKNKSPFRFDFWDHGSMRLRFRLAKESVEPASDFSDFQAYRKVMGVLGLCYAPASDIDEAYAAFNQFTSRYPSLKAKRCFIFEPSEEQVAHDSKSREHLIMFPPGERKALEYHVTTMMHDFCAHLLMALEEYVLLAENMGSALTSPLDGVAMPGQLQQDASLQKKQRLGRVQKSIGDHCLLAGSQEDAHDHYMTAIDLARQSSDVLWHAGAIEGLVTSQLVHHEQRLRAADGEDGDGAAAGTPSSGAQMEEEALTSLRVMYYEAISLYTRRNATILAQEATLKLANIISRYGQEPTKEVMELVTSVIERASDNDVSNQERMIIMLEVANIMRGIGCERKAALAIWNAVRYAELLEKESANKFAVTGGSSTIGLKLCLELVHMFDSGPEGPEGFGSAPTEGSVDAVRPLWNTLQRGVLAKSLEWSARTGDAVHAWSSAAKLLINHHGLISARTQRLLSSALRASASLMSYGAIAIEPLFTAPRLLEVHEKPSYLRPSQWTSLMGHARKGSRGIFLYSPYESMDSPRARTASNAARATVSEPQEPWVCGEEGSVLVELENPYLFDVALHHVQLATSGVEFEAQPISLLLAKQSRRALTLRGTPTSSGRLKIDGLTISAYGVTWFKEWASKSFDNAAVLRPHCRSVCVPVVRTLPFLHRTCTNVEASVVAVSQIEGECTEMGIDLMNSGQVPVTEISILVEQKRSSSSSAQVSSKIEVHTAAFKQLLPIAPGTSVSLRFDIIACHKSTGSVDFDGPIKEFTNIIVQYGGHFEEPRGPRAQNVKGKGGGGSADVDETVDTASMRHGRRLVIPLSLETRPGPRLRTVALHNYAMRGALGHQLLAAVDVFNPTSEDIELNVNYTSSSSSDSSSRLMSTAARADEQQQASSTVYLSSMCGKKILLPVGPMHPREREIPDGPTPPEERVSLMWISKSRLVGDLSSTLDEAIRSLRRSPASRSMPTVVGSFSSARSSGEEKDEDVDIGGVGGDSLKRLAVGCIRVSNLNPSTVYFHVKSTFALPVRATFSFYVRVGSRNCPKTDVEEDGGRDRDAEMLLLAGNWKSCSVLVPAHASSVCALTFLPVRAGVCSIVPRLESVVHIPSVAENDTAPCKYDGERCTSGQHTRIDEGSEPMVCEFCHPASLLLPASLEVV